jgi:hypothetical protein
MVDAGSGIKGGLTAVDSDALFSHASGHERRDCLRRDWIPQTARTLLAPQAEAPAKGGAELTPASRQPSRAHASRHAGVTPAVASDAARQPSRRRHAGRRERTQAVTPRRDASRRAIGPATARRAVCGIRPRGL